MARAAAKKQTKRVKRQPAARRRRAAAPRAKAARRRAAAKPKRAARAAKRTRGASASTARTRQPAARRRAGAKPAAGRKARPAAKPRASATSRAAAASRAAARPRAAVTPRAPRRAPARTRPAAASRPVAAPPQPAFAAQRALATAREELLFEIQRARASVKAAIQGLTAASAERPIAAGKWSIKEIVLHLSERDRVRLEEFSRTLGGFTRTWAGLGRAEEDAINEAHLAPLRAHGWDAAVKRLDSQRELLLLRLSEVPALPDDVWRRGHPFADMMWGLPEHDRHHAEQIKQARIGELLPMED